jgi:hypothetical protein
MAQIFADEFAREERRRQPYGREKVNANGVWALAKYG